MAYRTGKVYLLHPASDGGVVVPFIKASTTLHDIKAYLLRDAGKHTAACR